MSINRGMDKDDMICEIYICVCICVCVCVYKEILLSRKKGWNNDICNNIEGSRDFYTESSKQTERQIHNITYMWDLKKKGLQMHLSTKKK